MKVETEKLKPEDVSQLVAQNPRILYRPLLTNGENLVIGFKEEEMEEIL